MVALIFVGWVLGGLIGIFAGLAIVGWGQPMTVVVAVIAITLVYVVAYSIATRAIAPLLPPLVRGTIAFPAGGRIFPASGSATTIPATRGEYFARGLMIGLTAALNYMIFLQVPAVGPPLGAWAAIVISLGAIVFVARNRVYQGFLGWSGWLFPVSWVATIFGLALFLINIPFAFTQFGRNAFQLDWTTGVIASAGGIARPAAGGYSLGNFIFTRLTLPAGSFNTPSTASHETGHSLNTAVCGGIALWIDAVDENLWPMRRNLAYGELCAEGHARAMRGPPLNDFSVRLWY